MAKAEGPTRREFLAAGAGGVAGAALLGACSRPREPGPDAAATGPLVTRTLGRTGLKLPIVSIGSAYEAGIVSAALDAGLTYVHTSGSYADQNHERMLSRVFRGRPRDSFVVGSSPDFPEYRFEGGGRSADLGTRADASTIAPFCEGSLQRLGERAGLTGLYCQQCADCLPQCPAGADVPALMRAHMYAAGHGRPAHALHVLRGCTASDIPCSRCDACVVRCTLGFDVRARAVSVARLLAARPIGI